MERQNKIKEAVKSESIIYNESDDISKLSISSDEYKLSSTEDEFKYIIKYNDIFLVCELTESHFGSNILINKKNLVNILSSKKLLIENSISYSTNLYVEKSSTNNNYVMVVIASLINKDMSISHYEKIYLHFTKIHDQLTILNERLKSFESKKDSKYGSLYDFFMS